MRYDSHITWKHFHGTRTAEGPRVDYVYGCREPILFRHHAIGVAHSFDWGPDAVADRVVLLSDAMLVEVLANELIAAPKFAKSLVEDFAGLLCDLPESGFTMFDFQIQAFVVAWLSSKGVRR